jgi:hydroxymethylbilane synthase
VGAHATVVGDEIHLDAIVARPDGSEVVRGRLAGHDPQHVGATLGRTLLDDGAEEILSEVYGA